MEHQLWKAIVAVLAALDKRPKPGRCRVLGRATSSRCITGPSSTTALTRGPVEPANWPAPPARPPAPVTQPPVPPPAVEAGGRASLDALERRVVAPAEPGLFWVIDGKPLAIGGCSKDRQAGYGRAAGGKAKGYKVHAVVGAGGDRGLAGGPDEHGRAGHGRAADPVAPASGGTWWGTRTTTRTSCTRCATGCGSCSSSPAGGTGRARGPGTASRRPAGCGRSRGWRTRSPSSRTDCWRTGQPSSGRSGTG